LLTLICIVSGSGCVRLAQQRFTIRYDKKSDTLYMMIHYDGVHDSGEDNTGKGVEQIPEFVREGNILFGDWFAHLQMEHLREATQSENQAAATASTALLNSMKTRIIGHYVDSQGRIGGVQMVSLSNASELVKTLNDMFSAELVKAGPNDTPFQGPGWPGTRQRIMAAAQAKHQWFAINGHALELNLPVHPREWAQGKADLVSMLVSELEKNRGEVKLTVKRLVQTLFSAPVAYIETSKSVTFRLGDPNVPTTKRLTIRDEYKANLVDTVKQHVPASVDELMARQALGLSKKKLTDIEALITWGPEEEVVRSMIRAAESKDQLMRPAAFEWLKTFAETWNNEHNVPKMPADANDRAAFIGSCTAWCQSMARFPESQIDTTDHGHEHGDHDHVHEDAPANPALPGAP
jgi:hypothetical protein